MIDIDLKTYRPDARKTAEKNLRDRIERLKDPTPWQIKEMETALSCLSAGNYPLGERHMHRAERHDLFQKGGV